MVRSFLLVTCCCCWVASVVSNSVRPHRRQPTRLPRPWDSPGKNTGVGCHFLLQCMKVKSERENAQSCPTLSNPMDCSLPGSSIHGIFPARILEWGAIAIYLSQSRYLTDACVMKEHHWQRFQKCSCFLLGTWGRAEKEVSDLRSWSWGKKQESLYCLFVCFLIMSWGFFKYFGSKSYYKYIIYK